MTISYIFTLLIYVARCRILKTLMYIAGVTLFALTVFLWLVFHLIIGPQIITLVGETNTREATEFLYTYLLSPYGIMSICITLSLIVLIIIAERNKNKMWIRIKNSHRHLVNDFCKLLLVIALVIGFFHFDIFYYIARSKTIDDLSIGDPFPFDAVTGMTFSLNSVRTTSNEIYKAIATTEKAAKGTVGETDSMNVIYIIGESYIKRHSSLYGYPLKTSPRLEEE